MHVICIRIKEMLAGPAGASQSVLACHLLAAYDAAGQTAVTAIPSLQSDHHTAGCVCKTTQVSKAKDTEAGMQQKDAYIRKLEARLLNQHKTPAAGKAKGGIENNRAGTSQCVQQQLCLALMLACIGQSA